MKILDCLSGKWPVNRENDFDSWRIIADQSIGFISSNLNSGGFQSKELCQSFWRKSAY